MPSSPPPEIRVGIDAVAVERVTRLLGEHDRAAETLFTAGELRHCRGRRRSGDHLAARFAAKEAVLKAFGTGLGPRMRWTDVEVVTEPGGHPAVALHGEAAALGRRRGLDHVDLSLTHTGGLALAAAVTVWNRAGAAPCAST